MADSSRVVDVEISRSSPVVSAQAFSAAMILGKFTCFTQDVVGYTSLAAMLTAGFLTSDPEYLAATDYFAQNPKPSIVYLGRRAMTRTLTITAVNSFHYIVTIAGTPYEYDADSDATTSEIQAGLIAVINAATSTHHLVASASSTDVVILTGATGYLGVCPTVTVSAHLVKADGVVSDTIANDIARIQRANQSWYGIILADRDNTDASSVASYIESAGTPYFFPYASADSNIIDSSVETSSLAYAWKLAGYTRSMIFYHSLAATRYPDAAFLGSVLPATPGAWTGKFRSLVGIPADSLTDSEINVAAGYYSGATWNAGKNAMVYVSVGGVSMTLEGRVASGEFVDVIVFVDWLKSDMTAAVFTAFVSSPKIPFTDAGLQGLGSLVKASIARGVAAGGLASSPAPVVNIPLASSYTPTQKATRNATGITFSATLAGAIHYTTINGVVTV